MALLLVKGLCIGLIVAMPFGPSGLICLLRTLRGGARLGLVSGLGLAVGDAIYCAVAAFSITSVTSLLTGHHFLIQMVGGVVLLVYGGLQILHPHPPEAVSETRLSSPNYWLAFLSMLLLTLASPATLAGFFAAFTAAGLGHYHTDALDAWLLVASVFCGSFVWWALIAAGGEAFERSILNHLSLVRRIAGCILAALGLAACILAS